MRLAALAAINLYLLLIEYVMSQMRDDRLKKDDGGGCRGDRVVNGSGRSPKSDAETARGASPSVITESRPAVRHAVTTTTTSESASDDRLLEDVSDASAESDLSSRGPSPLPQRTTTSVTVVGNGLIQLSPADPTRRRFSYASEPVPSKRRCVWSSAERPVDSRSVSPAESDDESRPAHLVQLQNILPLFVFGRNSDGARSAQLAVIGNRRLNSEILKTTGTAPSSENVVDDVPASTRSPPRSASQKFSASGFDAGKSQRGKCAAKRNPFCNLILMFFF